MDMQTKDPRDYRMAIGFALGAAVGAGLMMWLAPRAASELRQRVTDSAKNLGERAFERYRQAGARLGETVDDLTRKGQGVRDDVAETVARGAREVERYATAANSDRVA